MKTHTPTHTTPEDWDLEKDTVLLDGLDSCIIGKEYSRGVALYSIERIIEVLMIRDNLELDQAIEFFDTNIGCAYMGEKSPVFCWTEV